MTKAQGQHIRPEKAAVTLRRGAGERLEQWGFFFDQTRCVGCKACVLACKAWNEDRRGDAALNPVLSWLESDRYAEPREYDSLPGSAGELNYREYARYHMKEDWRRVYTREFGHRPPDVDVLHFSVSCSHCDDPACIKACPTGHIDKEPEFGIVRTNPETACIGCRRCQAACPWGSPQFYDNQVRSGDKNGLGSSGSGGSGENSDNDSGSGEKPAAACDRAQRPQMTKCDLCYDRIRDGLKPACVAGCIMRALDAGPMDELKARYPDATLQQTIFPDCKVPTAGIGTRPNIIIRSKRRCV